MNKHVKKEGWEWLKSIGIGVILFVFIRTFLFSNYIVEGESMNPTLEDGNLLVVNKIGMKISDLHRFDVVVFHANEDEDFVKRVIGLPGDAIEYKNDTLYVNGTPYDEPYLKNNKQTIIDGKLTADFTTKEYIQEGIIPDGYIFVMGDNRLGSWDSRHFGLVSMDKVVGIVNLRYWPFSQIDTDFFKS
ncbi:signal peptidase I [Bacillus sp. HMF5848]|uniref:signal peptidase I n=1 Tax=Bacillus sp. HMF5848 TaxID=2495421 RepID=UPI000F7ADA79|nr:signal peptidase I [Bacillus sp. HMF5848]RSK26353.1 signal peptidase I [Bacillus sp. HMF5848]